MKNVVITVVVLVLALPLILAIMPASASFDRAMESFKAKGMVVEYEEKIEPAQLEAMEQMTMYVNGAVVNIYHYDDEGKIAKNLEYQRPDAGSAAVAAMGIGVSLGAAPSRNIPVTAERNGMWMITIQSEDKVLRQQIASAFGEL